MTEMTAEVLAEVRGQVGFITLNRAKALNALNDALMDELGDALKAFDPFTATLQIGVIDDHQVGKDAKQLGQIGAQRRKGALLPFQSVFGTLPEVLCQFPQLCAG